MPRTGRPPRPASERFFRRTQLAANGCIEWTGRIDRYGYGQFLPAGGRSANNMGAHRWSYEHHFGPIPSGLQIDHLCRNTRCVNPDHLEAVTPQENVARREAFYRNNSHIKRRHRPRTHCRAGHPYNEANIHVWPNGDRACRTCMERRRETRRQRRLERKAS